MALGLNLNLGPLTCFSALSSSRAVLPTHLAVLLKLRSSDPGWDLRFCISDKLPGDAHAASPRLGVKA